MSINNSVTLSGNLTRDLEIRNTAGGTVVGTFGMAVNDPQKNQDGSWDNYTNFINCTLFGNRASSIEQWMKKGQKVTVHGKLRWSKWEKNGQQNQKIEVIVNDVDIHFNKSDNQTNNSQQTPAESGSAPVDTSSVPF